MSIWSFINAIVGTEERDALEQYRRLTAPEAKGSQWTADLLSKLGFSQLRNPQYRFSIRPLPTKRHAVPYFLAELYSKGVSNPERVTTLDWNRSGSVVQRVIELTPGAYDDSEIPRLRLSISGDLPHVRHLIGEWASQATCHAGLVAEQVAQECTSLGRPPVKSRLEPWYAPIPINDYASVPNGHVKYVEDCLLADVLALQKEELSMNPSWQGEWTIRFESALKRYFAKRDSWVQAGCPGSVYFPPGDLAALKTGMAYYHHAFLHDAPDSGREQGSTAELIVESIDPGNL